MQNLVPDFGEVVLDLSDEPTSLPPRARVKKTRRFDFASGVPAPQGEAGGETSSGQEPVRGAEPEVFAGVDAYEVARRMGIQSASQLTPFLRAIYERIAQRLGYPEELIQMGRTGRVAFQFEVDRTGLISGGFSGVVADDRYLKVAAMRAVRRALDEPLAPTLFSHKDRLRIALIVQYAITINEDTLGPREMAIAKNTLNFRTVAIRGQGIIRLSPHQVPSTSGGVAEVNPVALIGALFKEEPKPEVLERYQQDPNF